MRRRQGLSKFLRDLADLLDQESANSPQLAARLDAIVASLRERTETPVVRKRRPAFDSSIPDVLSVLEQKGDQEFRFWLRSLHLATLKAIVKSNGFDVARVSQRWTDPDKFVALIAEQAGARLRRGSGFLPMRNESRKKE